MKKEKSQPKTETEKKERYMSLFYDALEEMYDDSELNFNESELNEISL